jgi:hypothetical protein
VELPEGGVLLQNANVQLMAAVVLAAVIITGCAAGRSGPAETMTGRDEAGTSAETRTAVTQQEPQTAGIQSEEPGETVPEESAKQATVEVKQSEAREQPGDVPPRQEKPMVIVSENPVFADTGQLLAELDKELELFLDILESTDDITEEELNF